MSGDERHVYGPRPVGALVSRLTRAAFRRRAPATAQVIADWTAIMGPAIASVALPRRTDPAKLAAVEVALGNLPNGDLRTALASLGRALATQSNRSRS